jgi:hypothetical protein
MRNKVVCSFARLSAALVLIALGTAPALMGQDVPITGASDLSKNADGTEYTHFPSQTRIPLPKGWKARGAKTEFGRTSFEVSEPARKISVKVSWMPMEPNLNLKDYADLERTRMNNEFGKKYVSGAAGFKAGDRAGYKISLDYGPGRLAAAYVFECGPDVGKKSGSRWRLSLFAFVPRDTADEDFGAVEAMMKNITW